MSYSYYQTLRDIQTAERLKRSRIEAQLSQQTVRQQKMRSFLFESEIQNDRIIQQELSERQRFIHKQLNQALLRRSRIQTDIQTNRIQRQAALRRSRLQSEIKSDKINRHLQKSRLESQIQASRLQSKRTLQDVLRRSKVQANVNYFLNKY